MRILVALTLFAAACGGTQPKKESALVNEGSDQAPTCCCKTIPQVGEKDIVPVYTMTGRMECSSSNGDCVDDVQCNGQNGPAGATQAQPANGEPPPPPVLAPSTSSTP